MENTVKDFNDLARKYFDGLDFNLKPIYFQTTPGMTNVTVVPKSEDAFNLISIKAGFIKNLEPKQIVNSSFVTEEGKPVALYRGIIGYMGAKMSLENPAYFMFSMIANINDGLRQLQEELGDMRKYDVSIKGFQDDYFRDMENYAGYEFRIVVKNKKG